MDISRAEYKPVQLAAARVAGLRVPDTLITNDPRSDNPAWLPMVYSDAVLTTQLNGDDSLWTRALAAPVAGEPTSSSSQPSLMAQMLEALDISEAHRVLEIGTGTGYNAALMSHRLGSTQVTTTEVDPQLCARAEAVLHECGYTPKVFCGDGTGGYEPGAPYDRIIATCSIPAVPRAWITQTRPGGLILVSLYRPLGGGPLVRLTVAGDGTAQGRFMPGGGGFMPTRDQPDIQAMELFKAAVASEATDQRRPTAVESDVLEHPDFGMLAALVLLDTTSIEFTPTDEGPQRWLLSVHGDWACLDIAASTVAQHGRRLLWDELEATYDAWQQAGRPTRDQMGLTVTPDRQWLWLNTPNSRFYRPASK